MWIFKYFGCIINSHSFVDITLKDSPYQFCLSCGKVTVQDTARESIFVEGESILTYPPKEVQL